jgi:undecaprenyl-diphosphatase
MIHQLSYLQAIVIGLVQGLTELFPISSLGHTVLIPSWLGGSWAALVSEESRPESPYLAFIVGLHLATALVLIAYYWREWLRLIRGLITSLITRRIQTPDQRLAWLIVIATIPVGVAGLALEHTFRVLFARPEAAALFLMVNGGILVLGERYRRRAGQAAAPGAGAMAAAAGQAGPTVPAGMAGAGLADPVATAPGSPASAGPTEPGALSTAPPTSAEPARTEPARTEPARTEPARTETARTGSAATAGPGGSAATGSATSSTSGDNSKTRAIAPGASAGLPPSDNGTRPGPGGPAAPPLPPAPAPQAAAGHTPIDGASEQRLADLGWRSALWIGAAQILALFAGISREGVTMAGGLVRGLSHEDAMRFSFLLSTPVILAAGALKIPDLTGPLGAGIRGQVIVGSVAAAATSLFAIVFLSRYFRTRTLTPFAIYCLAAGLISLIRFI